MPRASHFILGLLLWMVGCTSPSPVKPGNRQLVLERHIITTLSFSEVAGKTFTLENAESVLNNSTEYRNYALAISRGLQEAGLLEIEKSRTSRPDFIVVYQYNESTTGTRPTASNNTPTRPRRFFGFSQDDDKTDGKKPTADTSQLTYHSELEIKFLLPGSNPVIPYEKLKTAYESVCFGSTNESNRQLIVPQLLKFQLSNFPGRVGASGQAVIELPSPKPAR